MLPSSARNGAPNIGSVATAIINRKLRFGGPEMTRSDVWFNELFEKAELAWLESMKKATELLEETIFGSYDDSGNPINSNSTSKSVSAPSARVQNERAERTLRPLLESFAKIRAPDVSLRTVVSNLHYLTRGGESLPDSVMTEDNLYLLIGLVRNYLDFVAVVPPSSLSPEKTSLLGETTIDKPKWLISALMPSPTELELHEQIVELVLTIFTAWSKSGSTKWNLSPSVYTRHPSEVRGRGSGAEEVESENPSLLYVPRLKRLSFTVMNGQILDVLHVARKPSLMTRCFVQLAHSTIVLRSPEKDIPTQVFVHYMQGGPLKDLNRPQYLEFLHAMSVLVRHMSSLDQVLEMMAIVLKVWSTASSPLVARPRFHAPVPPEAQHLPPTPLMNVPTQLVVVSPQSPTSPTPVEVPSTHLESQPSESQQTDHQKQITNANTSPLDSQAPQLANEASNNHSHPESSIQATPPSLEEPKTSSTSSSTSSPPGKQRLRRPLPSLQHQFDIFNWFRVVTLWRRWDQGWSEAVDEETHATALTIQYAFVTGPPQTQVIALMAAMGVLEALVQSNALSHPHTLSVLYNMLTSATMRVARNDVEIRHDWRSWRQTISVIATQFDQAFPFLDDALLLHITVDVLLEDAFNVDYLFFSDFREDSLKEMLKKLDQHTTSFLLRRLFRFTQTIASMVNHTKHNNDRESTIFKLHSYAVRVHHMWRVYQPKFRAFTTDDETKVVQNESKEVEKKESAKLIPNKRLTKKEKENHLGIAVEKKARAVLGIFFLAFCALFEATLPSLSYKQITRAVEALGFFEFAAPKGADRGAYGLLLRMLLDRFHELRPDDNWIVSSLNLGIASIFGGSSQASRESSLQLDKPCLARMHQLFIVTQYTCQKYPHLLTRSVLEHRGLLSLLFWTLENPHKRINKKAHQTFAVFFAQPKLLENDPLTVAAPNNDDEATTSVANPSGRNILTSENESDLETATPVTLARYQPRSFTDEVFPYYWKLTLDCYPEKTHVETIKMACITLLTNVPIDSPLIPLLFTSFLDKIISHRFSKYSSELMRLLISLLAVVPHSGLPLLLSLLESYVRSCPYKLQSFLMERFRDAILANLDYSRKEILLNWCMQLINSLGFNAKL